MKYILSPYARIIEINDKYDFMYNTLYGNGIVIEKSLTRFLSTMEMDKNEIINIIEYDLFQELVDTQHIVIQGEDVRAKIKLELIERKNNLKTGQYFDRLHLSTTNKCNMGCKYCFCTTFKYDGIEKKSRFPRKEMNFEIAKQAILKSINILKKNNKSTLSIEFFGGEPMLNYDLIIQVLKFFKNGQEYNINIEYGCTTNGSIIPDELIPYLKDYDVRIAISIDYINELTGEYRGDGTVNVNWRDVKQNIEKLCKFNVKVKMQAVLSEETWHKFSYELFDFAAKNNIQSVGIILSFDSKFYTLFGSNTIANRILDIYDYAQSKNIQITGYWYLSYLGIINPQIWEKRRAWKTCPTIGRLLSVETDGSVYACKTTSKKLGHIEDFDNIFHSEEYAYYAMRAYSNSPDCEGCIIEGFCSGNCTGAVENQYNKIDSVDKNYCEIIKIIVNGLLKRYFQKVEYNLNPVN